MKNKSCIIIFCEVLLFSKRFCYFQKGRGHRFSGQIGLLGTFF
eukprot:UN14888